MSTTNTTQDHELFVSLPVGWKRSDREGQFDIAGQGRGGDRGSRATVRVFEPLSANPDYLIARFDPRASSTGTATVQSLPDSVADGISVVTIEENDGGNLSARIDLVRRAWNLDIIVTARTQQIDTVETLFSSMLELLAAIQPRKTTS